MGEKSLERGRKVRGGKGDCLFGRPYLSYIPDVSDLPVSEDADYIYICENNTIYGTKFHKLPDTKGKPLVADVSSCFCQSLQTLHNTGLCTEACKRISDRQV